MKIKSVINKLIIFLIKWISIARNH